jgi:Spondin_N
MLSCENDHPLASSSALGKLFAFHNLPLPIVQLITMPTRSTAVAAAGVIFTALARITHADIVVENDLIKPEDVYNFTYSTDSDVWWRSVNATRYYCVFRSHWTSENQPNEYPRNARWSDILLYSTNKEYRPWLLNRATTLGVEKVAEVRCWDGTAPR